MKEPDPHLCDLKPKFIQPAKFLIFNNFIHVKSIVGCGEIS